MVWTFDNLQQIGGRRVLRRAWRLLAPGGTLVSYSIAAHASGPMVPAFMATLARLAVWNALADPREVSFPAPCRGRAWCAGRL